MEQSPSRDVQNGILKQMNAVHSLSFYFLNIHCNIITKVVLQVLQTKCCNTFTSSMCTECPASCNLWKLLCLQLFTFCKLYKLKP
jgi:hypothetical protein